MPSQPLVSLELLEYLEATYKDQFPSKSQLKDEREVWFKAGQVDVVRSLRNLHEEPEAYVLRQQAEDT